jgi:hypothetical protein
MPNRMVTCLYCQSINNVENKQGNEDNYNHCKNCGMPLSKETPNSVGARKKRFLPFFWFVVIFCIVMVFYLPR